MRSVDLDDVSVLEVIEAVEGAIAAVVVEQRMLAGLAGVVVLAIVHVGWVRVRPVPAKVLGMLQMILGMSLVAASAIGVLAA